MADTNPNPCFYYHIGAVIGKGASGTVYRAFSNAPGVPRIVAVKKSKETNSSRNEATIMGQIPPHPNFPRFFHTWVSFCGKRFIAMELIEGGKDLKQWLLERDPKVPINPLQICRILVQIFEAIAHLHEHLIFHGDIKLANIMIIEREDGTIEIKLIDFDFSTHFHAVPQMQRGTPLYFSPEISRGINIDYRSDIWSSGILILFLLTGVQKPWFLQDAQSVAEIVKILGNIHRTGLQFPRELLENEDPNVAFFARIARSCLALEKSERPKAKDIVMELKEKLAELECADQERADQEPADQECANQECANQERADQERANQECADQECADQERADQECADQECANQERANQESADQECADQECADQERANQERTFGNA